MGENCFAYYLVKTQPIATNLRDMLKEHSRNVYQVKFVSYKVNLVK